MTTAYEASPVFESGSPQLSYLNHRINDGSLAIPDFQRDFVWDSKAVLELLQSVMSRYPAGSILTWKQDPQNPQLASRAIQGAPALTSHPNELVLDGQQRLTSLYRALSLDSDEAYFVMLREFVNSDLTVKSVHEIDWDNALVVKDTSAKRNQDSLSKEWQFETGAFPLKSLPSVDDWLDEYARNSTADFEKERELKTSYRKLRDTYLIPLRSYGFPVIALPAHTPIQAVCTIFETLNRTGRPLGAFELVTARLYPQEIRLRDLWQDAIDQYSSFTDFNVEPYTVLQAVCLRARGSAQRADVLKNLGKPEIDEHWRPVVDGMASVLEFLQSECGVVNRRLLPYTMLTAPMAAVWPDLKEMKPLIRAEALEKMRVFFWCTTFMTNYDQGANSQAGADFKALRQWIKSGDTRPEAVENFNFSEEQLLSTSVRRKALLAGVMALTVTAGAKDFHSAQKLTRNSTLDGKIDSHHIFPKAFLGDPDLSELVLNRALIDSETNKIIGKKAPSDYLQVMFEARGEDRISTVLESHLIPEEAYSAMQSDDFDLFLESRSRAICEQIEAATGKEIVLSNE